MASQYVGWEEVVVSKEKGRREVQYFLKRRISFGSWDLAVIGKERTPRHMSYHYALPNHLSASSSSFASSFDSVHSRPKLKSRRDVLDWLSSMVSDLPSHSSLPSLGSSLDADRAVDTDISADKNPRVKNFAPNSKEFLWLGSLGTCRKRRRHYRSFRRNGIKISLHDFVYVLAEDNKRLVAHLEDLYEDSRGNKMVVVRWFHKIDEVGLVLPPNFNDREIFFSLCLQDISVECIDGLAAILNPQHYKKYLNEAMCTLWEPFMCHRLFHEDNLSPFDITHVQGYWKQDILRCMYATPSVNQLNTNVAVDSRVDGHDDEAIEARPLKRQCGAKGRDLVQHLNDGKDVKEANHVDRQKFSNGFVSIREAEISGLKNAKFNSDLPEKKMIKQMLDQQLAANCHVEVLSQDSGIRGCWFRALVLKRHKNKVKVRYQDIKDAENEANFLEEWILSTKIAVPDELGIRNLLRAIVRPKPSDCKGSVSLDLVDSGSIVDAWWNDGWWEGIVVCKESEDRIHVYFPGEKKLSIFGCEDLRLSQDWVSNEWNLVKGRPDLVSSILSRLQTSQGGVNSVQHLITDNGQLGCINTTSTSDKKTLWGEAGEAACPESHADTTKVKVNNVPDLTKDGLLTQIKWSSSRKRRRNRALSSQRNRSSPNSEGCSSSSSSGPEDTMDSTPGHARYSVPNSLNADHAKCNYGGDSLLSASMPPLASLVMSI